jgi:hypothetical protein
MGCRRHKGAKSDAKRAVKLGSAANYVTGGTWDTLQLVGDPKSSAPMLGPNIPRANPNGMF